MPGGQGWRHCLVAILFFVGRADFSRDLRDGGSEDSRTGNLSGFDNDSNESRAEDAEISEEAIEEIRNAIEQANSGHKITDNSLHDIIMNQESISPYHSPEPLAPVFPAETNILIDNEVKSAQHSQLRSDPEERSALGHQYNQAQYPGGPVIHDNPVFPKDPSYEPEIIYISPYNEPGHLKPAYSAGERLFSKVIPLERHIMLHNIPGAQNAIQCSKEGELHNFWAPSFQCMVCVCLSSYGRLRPVCVSCSTCLAPPGPPGPPVPPTPPYTTPGPTPSPEQVSCKPLPANLPFQSPLDPCKICVCTETLSERGQMNVQINCQHNPQCVVPPYSTPRPPGPTPIPPPVCNELPQNVPFPHPDEPCQLCVCSVRVTPYGVHEHQVDCYMNPECQPTEQPEPITESPRPLPGPEICDHFPDNVIFPHPQDNCQVCKCSIHPSLLFDKKQIICYMRPNCIPTTETPIGPEPNCEGYPENLMFPHPTDACKICKCVRETKFFNRDKKLICYLKSECTSTPRPRPISTPSPWPVSSTTQPPMPPQPDDARCAPLPTGTPFQNPLNPCQVCVCTERVDLFGRSDVNIECQENPQCVLPDNATVLPPDIITPIPLPICNEFPENVYFPHPREPCQVCKCSAINTPYGVPKQHISCYLRPECLPTTRPPIPPTPDYPTERPDLHVCDLHLENVVFPDPLDPCKLCKCYRDINSIHQKKLSCFLNPECSPSPSPTPGPGPTPEPTPVPETVSCAPFPTGSPFQNPLNPCQICICTERADLFGRHDVNIECEENPQCVLPPDVSTLPPIVSTPIPLPVCKEFPENVLFPHPHDPCQVCKCTIQRNLPYGPPEEVISCIIIQECLPTPSPEPWPTTPAPDPILEICQNYPENTPFDDPTDPCRVCVCTTNLLPGASFSNQLRRVQLQCLVKPECSPIPPTVRPDPNPYEICARYGINTPFDDPTDPCRVCTCIESYPGSQLNPISMQPPPFQPRIHVQCLTKPECLPTLPPPTEVPQPYDLCGFQPLNVPFTHPSDPCQSCVCFVEPGFPETPSQSLAPHTVDLKVHLLCSMKPECSPPVPEPIITTTLAPVPNDVSCQPLPSGTPFQNPLNPCQVCICKETVDIFGRPDVNIKCQENPQCVLPPDVTTIPPSPIITPVPLPACAKFPPNVVFPHPQDACQLCKCTVAQTAWGVPEQQISCFVNPECQPTPNPITVAPPEPTLCEQYPPNALFQLPQDYCTLCRCTVERTPYGEMNHISCFINPACSPRPPAPPGPLPGPAPHESCTPYIPNKPFQHPWDECQVCVCTEAISTERITIEVNCYTKPSCCIELPFNIPGLPGQSVLPGQSGFPIISGLPGSESIVSGPGLVKTEESLNNILSPKFADYSNFVDTAGGNLNNIANEPSNGNLIRPYPSGQTGENWFGSMGGHLVRPPSGNLNPRDSNMIGPTGGTVVISSSGNHISQVDGNINGGTRNIWSGYTGGNLVDSSGNKWIGSMSGNINGPTDGNGNNIKTSDGSASWISSNVFESTSGNLITSGGNLVNSNLSVKEYMRPNGNLIGPNLSYTGPGSNLYVSHLGNMNPNKNPIGNEVAASHWRVKQKFTGSGQVSGGQNQHHKHLPVNIGYSHITSGDLDHRYMYPVIGFREGEPSDLGTKAEAQASAQAQVAQANAEASASANQYKSSTKMRTKSGRPRDHDDSEDYD